MTPAKIAALALISAAVGACLGLALSLKDVVQRRVAGHEPVNPLLRVYFGMGALSLAAWFVTAIVGTIVIVIILPV